MSSSEMANFTAAEMLSLAASLNTGIAAAKEALIHASHNLQEEFLHDLRALDIFPNEMFRREWESPLERWPIIAFLISAVFCLFLSASYHLFNCHSRFLNDILLLLDYSGISILIAGSSIPPVFYGFYCDRQLGNFYLVAILSLSVLSFLIGIYSGLNPSSFWRVTRVLAYSANACFSMVPCGHMLVRWSAGEPMWGLCLPYLTCMLGLYALGTVIYTLQFPERYFPHRFDIYLSSHQLWHLLVFSAAFLHFFCAVGHFQWRTMHPCPAAAAPAQL
jgi:adiponectin receptor